MILKYLDSKKKPKMLLAFRIDKEMLADLKRIARGNKTTVSNIVRAACQAIIESIKGSH